MRIRHLIIKVDDQQKALFFYASVVGFVKKLDVPIGGVRWLTVSSPEGAEDVELVLEPNNFRPARSSQKTLYDAGFPGAVFTTNNNNIRKVGSFARKQTHVSGARSGRPERADLHSVTAAEEKNS